MRFDIGTLWHSYNLAHELGHEVMAVPRPQTPEETIEAAQSFERHASTLTRQASNLKAHGFIELTRLTPNITTASEEEHTNAENVTIQP